MTSKAEDDREKRMQVTIAALEEFSRVGRNESVVCDKCGAVLQIETRGDTAFTMKCDCGRYNDTLRGL